MDITKLLDQFLGTYHYPIIRTEIYYLLIHIISDKREIANFKNSFSSNLQLREITYCYFCIEEFYQELIIEQCLVVTR